MDERIVAPEGRSEVIDGRLFVVSPCDEPHGRPHSKLATLLETHVALGYWVAIDMLTRTGWKSDFAPDVSVYPAARDPQTGGRRLEELAFELVSTESLGHAARKAKRLVGRGVRRVFALDVERGRALVWSTATEAWEILAREAVVEDAALAVPLPLAAVLDAAATDDLVARALLAKHNAVLEAALAEREASGRELGLREGRVEGRVEGKLEALRAVLFTILQARGAEVSAAARARIEACTAPDELERWTLQAVRGEPLDAG